MKTKTIQSVLFTLLCTVTVSATADAIRASEREARTAREKAGSAPTCTVKEDDSTVSIATAVGVRVLMDRNDLKATGDLKPGQDSKLPAKESRKRAYEKAGSAPTYTVKEGDDLVSIAIALGISPGVLMDINDIKPFDDLKPGQVLKLPVKKSRKLTREKADSGLTYTVKEGEDLVIIAISFGISPSVLIDLNDLKSEEVKPGQVLKLPAEVSRQVFDENMVGRIISGMVQIPGKNYKMGKTEVTQVQWEAVMGENPSHFKGANNPVENVSLNDCQEFLKKLNALPSVKKSGLVFRLPTREEWEYASTAGSTNFYCKLADFTESTLGEVAWLDDNSNSTTHPVGQKKPNAFGLYDMYGNVWEMCEDNAAGRSYRVCRGGSWDYRDSLDCMGELVRIDNPDRRRSNLGFRLAASCRVDQVSSPGEARVASEKVGSGPTYTVKEDDDLVSIAISFGISPSVLIDLNDLKSEEVKPGQVLKLPANVSEKIDQ